MRIPAGIVVWAVLALLVGSSVAAEHTVEIRRAADTEATDPLPADQMELLPLDPEITQSISLSRLTIQEGKIQVARQGWSTTFDEKTLVFSEDVNGKLQPVIVVKGSVAEALERYTKDDVPYEAAIVVVLDGRVVAIHQKHSILVNRFVLPAYLSRQFGIQGDASTGPMELPVIRKEIRIPWYYFAAVLFVLVAGFALVLTKRGQSRS